MEMINDTPEPGNIYLDLVKGIDEYLCVDVDPTRRHDNYQMKDLETGHIDWYTEVEWSFVRTNKKRIPLDDSPKVC